MKLRSFLFSLALLVSVQGAYADERFAIGAVTYSVSGDTCRVYATSADISGDVTIPSTVTYNGVTHTVTEIGYIAFYNRTGVTSVTIPESVTTIDGGVFGAFENCTSLASVTIPNSVTKIGQSAFRSCTSLTSVTIPESMTVIEEDVFLNCTSLTSVTIPNSVTVIGEAAFQSCTSLTSITIPNSITVIGQAAFRYCSGLTSVTIPNSVTEIEMIVFTGCSSLTSVFIPSSVTTIWHNAFEDCTSLTSITIPNSVTVIRWDAFRNCSNLKDVTVSWDTPLVDVNETVFENVPLSEVTLHVPAGTEALYQAAPVWKDFRWVTSVGNEDIKQTTLHAWTTNGVLHISGLRPGKAFHIYTFQGQLLYKGIARTENEEIALRPTTDAYILATEDERIKFVSR